MRNLLAKALLLLSIAVASRAAVLPRPQKLLDTLHQVLSAATKETGLRRLKRSLREPEPESEWDKELDLTAIGVLFRIKFNDVERPEQGGKAHIKFPGSRFIKNAPFDDVDLQVQFDGSQVQEGQLNLTIGYKFVQKFKHKADLPREGSISLTRTLEPGLSGEWRTKLAMKRASSEQPLEHLLDFSFKSTSEPQMPNSICEFMNNCGVREFSSIIDYKVGNYFDLKGKIYPGERANLDLTVNGFVYSAMVQLSLPNEYEDLMKLSLRATWESRSYFLDFEVNPGEELGVEVKGDLGVPLEAKLVMQPDLTLGQFKISFDGQNLAFAQLKGEADLEDMVDQKLDYVLKYNVGSEAGKAKIDFNSEADGKKLQITLVPTAEKSIEHDIKIKIKGTEGATFQYDIKLEGTDVQKSEGILYVINNEDEFNITTEAGLGQTKENPLFETINKFYGTEIATTKKTRQLYYSKEDLDEDEINKALFEEEYVVNGQQRHHIKYDHQAPKTDYLLSYAPQEHTEAEWKYEGSREVEDDTLKLDHKITNGETVVQEGKISFQSTSELPEVAVSYYQELTTSPESPVYPLIQKMVGRHGTKIVQTGSLDLQLNLENLKLATSLTVDEQKISEVLVDNFHTGMRKASLKHVWSPDTFGTNHEVTVDWEPNTSVGMGRDGPKSGINFAMAYKRADQPILSYTNKAVWETTDEDIMVLILDTEEELKQTEESPLYSWGPTLQGKYWKDARRTLKLETLPKLIIRDMTYLDEELYRMIDIVVNEVKHNIAESTFHITWEQPSSGILLPSTRDVFGQDRVEFAGAPRPRSDPEGYKLTSNVHGDHSLKATWELIDYPDDDIRDNLIMLTLDGDNLVALETDHIENSARLTVFPGGADEILVCLSVPSTPYPAWPSNMFSWNSNPFPEIESSTARQLVFNTTRGQNRVDVVFSGIDNFVYGHSMFEPQSIGLDVSGNLPSLGEFKISREAQFQVFGEPEKISTYKIQWSGRDEVSEGDFASFSPMETMVVVDLNDTDEDSTVESFLKSSSIQAYKSFGGKRWGFNLSKDDFAIITGINPSQPIPLIVE